MAIGSFANKIFSVSRDRLYPISEYNSSCSLNVEEQEVEGSKPSSYIKNENLEEFKFSIALYNQRSVDVQEEIQEWKDICKAAQPYMLIIGGKPVCNNKVLLMHVEEQETSLNGDGKYFKAKLQLQFKEFVRNGYKQDEKEKKKRKNKNAKEANALGPQDEAKLTTLDNEIFGE